MKPAALRTLTNLWELEELAGEFRQTSLNIELVVHDGRAFHGAQRVSPMTMSDMAAHRAIQVTRSGGGVERYGLTDIGRAIARRPELAEEVERAIARGLPFRVYQGRIERI